MSDKVIHVLNSLRCESDKEFNFLDLFEWQSYSCVEFTKVLKKDLCALSCHWCMRVIVCWREQKMKWHEQKRDWKSDRAYLCKNKLYFFVFRGGKILVKLYTSWYCTNCFCQKFWYFPSGRDTLSFPVSSLVTFF